MLLSQTDPATYMMKFVMNMNMEQGIQALNQQPMPGAQPYVNPVSTNQQQPVPGNPAQMATEPPTNVTASPQGQ